MSESFHERRKFNRVATDKRVVVHTGDGAHHGTVLDASLRGLLYELHDPSRPTPGESVVAVISLDDGVCCIEMRGEVVHVKGNHVGMYCASLDLESASQLRRLVELNLTDHALLERDLEQLIA